MSRRCFIGGVTIRKVLVKGQMVQYQVTGKGDPLVLVHGLSASGLWWSRNVPALARHYQIYLIDLPGFGRMRHMRKQFILAEAASWLRQWMEVVGIKKAHFIGHSMGGAICMQLAAEYPEVVARLVLVAPAVLTEKQSVLEYILPLLNGVRYTRPGFLPILCYDAWRTGPFMLIRTANQILMHDMREKVQKIKTPTLLAWGKNDTLVPAALGPLLQKEIPGARLIIWQDAGHVCMFDQASAFNAEVIAFLQDAEKSATINRNLLMEKLL